MRLLASLFLLLSLAACDAGSLELCDNGIDDNGNGNVDCLDESCTSAAVCQIIPPPENVLDLGLPNDQVLLLAEDRPGGSFFGHPTEAGDLNGDGLGDVVSCALAANDPAVGEGAGLVSVFFSDGTFAGPRSSSDVGVLRLIGENTLDLLGGSAHVADFNGDGIDDLLVGAQNHNIGDRTAAGITYLVLGRTSFPSAINLAQADGVSVVAIRGATAGERLGIWTGAADLNGDGIQDLVIGADQFDADANRDNAGTVYVLQGGGPFPAVIDLAAEIPGQGVLLTKIVGAEREDHLGGAFFGGDFDGDGSDDLAIAAIIDRLSASIGTNANGAGGADGPNNSRDQAGDIHVLFGPLSGEIDLANTQHPQTIVFGASAGDYAGEEVLAADFDRDGAAELLIGALEAGRADAASVGRTYLLRGGSTLRNAGTIDLASPPADSLTLIGDELGELVGDTLAVADIDGDSTPELALGRPRRDVIRGDGAPVVNAGRVLLVFDVLSHVGTLDLRNLPLSVETIEIWAPEDGDTLAYSMTAIDLDGDGKDDLLPNAMRGDGINNAFEDAGEIYAISGALLSTLRK